MLAFLIGLLTVILILDCVILVFLVLIQLPKKEAGAGLAFGAGTTDALFGAGSGTILTKITKYAAATFFVLAVLLSVMQTHYSRRTATNFSQRLSQAESSPSAVLPPASAPAAAPTNNAAVTNAATGSNTAFQLESTTQITNAPVSNRPPAGATNP